MRTNRSFAHHRRHLSSRCWTLGTSLIPLLESFPLFLHRCKSCLTIHGWASLHMHWLRVHHFSICRHRRYHSSSLGKHLSCSIRGVHCGIVYEWEPCRFEFFSLNRWLLLILMQDMFVVSSVCWSWLRSCKLVLLIMSQYRAVLNVLLVFGRARGWGSSLGQSLDSTQWLVSRVLVRIFFCFAWLNRCVFGPYWNPERLALWNLDLLCL